MGKRGPAGGGMRKAKTRMCKHCKGSGQVRHPGIPGHMKAWSEPCNRCGGTGRR